MADRAHSTSRRALLAGLGMTPLVSHPAIPLTAEPVTVTEWETVPVPSWDAQLLAIGRELDAAYAAYLPLRPSELAAEEGNADALFKAGLHVGDERCGWYAESAGPFAPVMKAAQGMRERADRAAEAAFAITPRTFAGLAVLVRALAGYHVDLWDDDLDKLEIDDRMLRLTVEAALTLAGVDRLGRPLADGNRPY